MRKLVADNPLLLMAMSRFGISLGFGEKTVGELCREQGVDLPTFLAVANYLTSGEVIVEDISVGSMMAYLGNAHNYFLKFQLPEIRRRLVEAVSTSGNDDVAMLILKFYDGYTAEVAKHMHYEEHTVFDYVRLLLNGERNPKFSINVFASGHHRIDTKLSELKDIIIRYLPERNNHLLNAVLFDIMNCSADLLSHCSVEDTLFVPAVVRLEQDVEARSCRLRKATDTPEGEDDGADTELSERERDILVGVASGLSNKEIADKLCISVHTVTTHRRNIANKLQIHSGAGLAIYAVLHGIVSLDELK